MRCDALRLIVVGVLLAGCGTDPGAAPLADPPPEDAPEHVKESWEEAFRSEVERLEAQDPRPDMKRVLDGLSLPEGLVFVAEEEGPPYCFAGSCPYVWRHYVSHDDLSTTCRLLEREVRDSWGFSDARLKVDARTESCSGGGERGSLFLTATAVPIDDFRLHFLPVDQELPAADRPWVTGVEVDVVRPTNPPNS